MIEKQRVNPPVGRVDVDGDEVRLRAADEARWGGQRAAQPRLALELRQVAQEAEEEQADERDLDCDVDPEDAGRVRIQSMSIRSI